LKSEHGWNNLEKKDEFVYADSLFTGRKQR